jgi:hypothetical protein
MVVGFDTVPSDRYAVEAARVLASGYRVFPRQQMFFDFPTP